MFKTIMGFPNTSFLDSMHLSNSVPTNASMSGLSSGIETALAAKNFFELRLEALFASILSDTQRRITNAR
jgi:hypothetical protein